MLSGIYRITNRITGDFYIGMSGDLRSRFFQHVNLLERRKHHCARLQDSYLKHGLTAFVFEVIERCDDVEKLIERERYYIRELEPTLNMPVGGDPLPGLKRFSDFEVTIAKNDLESVQLPENLEERRELAALYLYRLGLSQSKIAKRFGVARATVVRMIGRARAARSTFTKKEKTALALRGSGFSDSEIAEFIGCSRGTANRMIHRAFRKRQRLHDIVSRQISVN